MGSYPESITSTSGGDVARSWQAEVHSEGASREYKVFAICSASSDATVVTQPFPVGFGIGDGVATCPAGTRALSGGIKNADLSHPVKVQMSGPVGPGGDRAATADGDAATSWYVSVENPVDVPIALEVFAICSKSSDATIAVNAFSLQSDEVGAVSAPCPAGSRALGGGISIVGPTNPLFGYVQSNGPVNSSELTAGTQSGDVARAWQASIWLVPKDTPVERDLRVLAICAQPDPPPPPPPAPPPPPPARKATCAGKKATIVGTSRADTIKGTSKVDVIAALGGNDTIFALGGNDIVCAGAGNDTTFAGSGNDVVYDGPGNDTTYGGPGNDVDYGGPGNDSFSGGPGKDTAHGGPGKNTFRQ